MKNILGLSIFLVLIKCFIAYALELGVDEAYYYTYTQPMQWSYFDHPLMVAVMQWVSTLGLHWESEFSLRLFPLLFGLLNPLIIFKIAEKIGDSTTAWWASILYLATLYGSVISGLFVLPDAPLSFFVLCAIYFSLQYIQNQNNRDLYLFSFFLAFAIASKYQAFFVGLAFFVYLVKYRREAFLSIHTYLAGLIAFIGFIPTLIWNAQHQWVNFTFHGNRVGDASLFEFFPREVLGQILYQNPIVYILIIIAFVRLPKLKNQLPSDILFYLKILAFPLWVTAIVNSIYTESLPHWSGISFIGFILISAFILPKLNISKNWGYLSYGLLCCILLLGFFEVQNGWLSNSISKTKNIATKGKGDPTQDVFGWQQLERKLRSSIQRHNINSELIVSHRWYPAGHLDYYVGRRLNREVIAEGKLYETHQYAYKDNIKFWKKNKGNAIFIAQSNSSFRPEDFYNKENFTTQPIDTIYIERRNDTVRVHFVYLMQYNEYAN